MRGSHGRSKPTPKRWYFCDPYWRPWLRWHQRKGKGYEAWRETA